MQALQIREQAYSRVQIMSRFSDRLQTGALDPPLLTSHWYMAQSISMLGAFMDLLGLQVSWSKVRYPVELRIWCLYRSLGESAR